MVCLSSGFAFGVCVGAFAFAFALAFVGVIIVGFGFGPGALGWCFEARVRLCVHDGLDLGMVILAIV